MVGLELEEQFRLALLHHVPECHLIDASNANKLEVLDLLNGDYTFEGLVDDGVAIFSLKVPESDLRVLRDAHPPALNVKELGLVNFG